MKTLLNWGFLSTARINGALIPAIRASSRSRLLGVASRSADKARQYAADHQIERSYGSYEDMLADPDIDVIYNPLPNDLHADWSIRAVQAGKNVLVEKPIALTSAAVQTIAAAAQASHKVVAEAFMYRHHPMTLKAKELIHAGALGQVSSIQGAFTFMLDRPNDIRWNPEQGGGSVWDIGCYPVSYTHWLTGRMPYEVFGRQETTASGVDLSFFGQMAYEGGSMPNSIQVSACLTGRTCQFTAHRDYFPSLNPLNQATRECQ
jgi:xylose dehydrogenase (NAD/NADP)